MMQQQLAQQSCSGHQIINQRNARASSLSGQASCQRPQPARSAQKVKGRCFAIAATAELHSDDMVTYPGSKKVALPSVTDSTAMDQKSATKLIRELGRAGDAAGVRPCVRFSIRHRMLYSVHVQFQACNTRLCLLARTFGNDVACFA